MTSRSFRALGASLVALALVASPLAGCSSMAGMSTFGSSKAKVAELPAGASYTVEGALSEARGHFRNNDFGHSAALYKRAVELAPKNAEAYVGLGASYDRLRRFDLSDRVYASLFALSGATAQYYNNVGYSYMLRGKLAEAMSNFRKAQQLAPDNVVIANNMQLVAHAAATSQI